MYIYWLGESSFKIKTDTATVALDPAASTTGLSRSTVEGDIVVLSHTLETDTKRVKPTLEEGTIFTIDEPGEYETKGVFVYGRPGPEGTNRYLLKTEDIKIAWLAGLDKELTDDELTLFENADIAFVPVGGNGVLSAKGADKVISQVEPRIVIPMNYKISKLKAKRDPVDAFLTEMGAKNVQPETSLNIKKSKLPHDETQIMLLSP